MFASWAWPGPSHLNSNRCQSGLQVCSSPKKNWTNQEMCVSFSDSITHMWVRDSFYFSSHGLLAECAKLHFCVKLQFHSLIGVFWYADTVWGKTANICMHIVFYVIAQIINKLYYEAFFGQFLISTSSNLNSNWEKLFTNLFFYRLNTPSSEKCFSIFFPTLNKI